MHFRNKYLRVGLIGYGYWGINLLRNLIENHNVIDIYLCDIDIEKCEKAKKLHPGIKTFQDANDVINDRDVDAVIIATPPANHYELAKKGLESNKHVLVEKPITSSTSALEHLIQLATNRNRILMVDHTFLYNPAIQHIKQLFEDDSLGKIRYLDSTRINLGAYQQDVNVLWDLACHDLSIVDYLIHERPTKLRTVVREGKSTDKEDLAYIFLYYSSGLLVQINCSWASPVKIRQIIIGAEKKMVIYDDIEPTQKIKIYDYRQVLLSNKSKNETLVDYRLGDIHIPKLPNKEPLSLLIEDFFYCISTGNTPVSNTKRAMNVTYLLEKAEESVFNNGSLIALT